MSSRRAAGFTLIELAVVIAIIGLLVAGAFTSFGAIRINTKLRETNQSLYTIEQLLQAFIARHGRLPCPAQPDLGRSAAGYGQEYNSGGYGTLAANGGGGGCNAALQIGGSKVYRGTFPALAFGRRVSMITDGWDTQFQYLVVGTATRTNSMTNGRWARDNNVEDEIELWDKAAADGSAPAPRQIVNLGVVAVISAGPNRNGGFTIDGQQLPQPPGGALAERDNLDDNVYLVSADYSEDANAPFDDMVRVWTEHDLLLPLALTGEVKTKRALTLARMRRIEDLIYGWAAKDKALPDCDDSEDMIEGGACSISPAIFGMAAGVTDNRDWLDAWGGPILYFPDADAIDAITLDGPDDEPGDILFELRSGGPDGNTSSGAGSAEDNIVFRYTRAEVVARLAAAGISVVGE
jgi:prepilin-type N-terminal cleavage/methylation domain-containing protein